MSQPYISAVDGSYYVAADGIALHPADTAVSQRPDPTYLWNNGTWTVDAAAAALAQYSALIAAGCQITSTSTPALNGTFPIADSDKSRNHMLLG